MQKLIFVAAAISVFLTTFNRGFFSWAGFSLLSFLLVILFIIFWKIRNDDTSKVSFIQQTELLLVFVYILFLFFSSGIYQTQFLPAILLSFIPLLLVPLVSSYLWHKPVAARIRTVRFLFLIGSACMLRVLMLLASPHPIIDVFTILKEAPYVLIQGANPYNTVYSPVYGGIQTNYYPYWPAAFILQLPFVLLFSDPRVLLVIADAVSAYLLYRIGKSTYMAELLVLVYLFRPNALFIIEQSWVTSLTFLGLLVTLYSYQRQKMILPAVSAALLVAIQPYFITVLPFIILLRQIIAKAFIALTAGLLVLVVVPFLVWDPAAFIDKTILVYFKPLEQIPTIPVHASLNLNTFVFLFSGKDIPFIIAAICLFAVSLALFLKLIHLRQDKKRYNAGTYFSFVLLSLTIFFYAFYFFFRQAFINYYYFAGDILIAWMVSLPAAEVRS